MAKRPKGEEPSFGSDSFLDIVCNTVGIMIILVMITGLRVQQYTREKLEAASAAPAAIDVTEVNRRLSPLADSATELTNENHRLTAELALLSHALDVRSQERDMLALVARDRENGLEKKRGELNAAQQAAFDTTRREREIFSEIATLEGQIASASVRGPAIELKTYPTPVSHTVTARETHFQLHGGRIVRAPLDELVEQLKREAPQHVAEMRSSSEFTDTFGPYEGFHLRYTLERVDARSDDRSPHVIGSMIRLREMSLIPTSNQLGETVDDALAARSQFRNTLASLPRGSTVTLWTYPDSFGDYNRVRAELHRLGFPAAGRALPEGQPISGSPEGSRSAAQ